MKPIKHVHRGRRPARGAEREQQMRERQEAAEARDRLVRYLVFQARVFDEQAARLLDPGNPEGVHANHRRGHVACHFLALYLTRHPANPYYRQRRALELFGAIARVWTDSWLRDVERHGTFDDEEWRPYIVLRGMELLGGGLEPALRRDAGHALRHWVAEELKQPFFFTAPNHEMWKLCAAALAGRVLRRPAWRRQARFEARQLLRYQTPDGFWEEGRHHGPSLSYNFVMLTALAMLARDLDDPLLRTAATRLADFMATWIFPDGSHPAALDGRVGLGLAFPVPGLDLTPAGVTLRGRLLQPWDAAGWLDAARRDTPLYAKVQDANFMAAAALLELPAWGRRPPAKPLLLDARRAAREVHSACFDATMLRRGPWAMALSSQLSDVPKDTQFIFRLERQNRIDVWHEQSSVVIGGGHSLVTTSHPLYNAWIEPGYHADPGDYSRTGDDAGSPVMARRRSKYYPRWAGSGCDGRGAWLELVFAHATIRFELRPEADRLTIGYSFACCGVEELRLCLPLVVWQPGRMLLDGRPLPAGGETVERRVRGAVTAEDRFHGTRTTLLAPKGGRTLFRYPLDVMRSYTASAAPAPSLQFYALGQMETVFSKPPARGRGEWVLRVEPL